MFFTPLPPLLVLPQEPPLELPLLQPVPRRLLVLGRLPPLLVLFFPPQRLLLPQVFIIQLKQRPLLLILIFRLQPLVLILIFLLRQQPLPLV